MQNWIIKHVKPTKLQQINVKSKKELENTV